MACTCSGEPEVTATVEKDELTGGYLAVKKCQNCEGVLDEKLLGPSSKYMEWDEEKILEQF